MIFLFTILLFSFPNCYNTIINSFLNSFQTVEADPSDGEDSERAEDLCGEHHQHALASFHEELSSDLLSREPVA